MPYVALMLDVTVVETTLVVTVKMVEVLPADIVAVADTWAAPVLLLESVTTAPPAGANPFNVTVPVELLPPATDVGFSVRRHTAGLMVKVAFALTP